MMAKECEMCGELKPCRKMDCTFPTFICSSYCEEDYVYVCDECIKFEEIFNDKKVEELKKERKIRQNKYKERRDIFLKKVSK